MEIEPVSNRKVLMEHFNRSIFLNLYNITELDDQNWTDSHYYAHTSDDQLKSVILLYQELVLPILSAVTAEHTRDNFAKLMANVKETMYSCSQSDWLKAFEEHPRIRDVESLRQKFGMTEHALGIKDLFRIFEPTCSITTK